MIRSRKLDIGSSHAQLDLLITLNIKLCCSPPFFFFRLAPILTAHLRPLPWQALNDYLRGRVGGPAYE